MANVTSQVQRAQAAYKACGFKRGEYKAQTEQVYRGTRNGVRMFDYGDLLSWVSDTSAANVERVQGMIKHGYDVSLTVYKGKVAHIGVKETRMPSNIGKVERVYIEETDEYGIPRRERVI